jgi:hypothetical protein
VLRDPHYQSILAAALDSFCDVLDKTTERARALGAYAVVRHVETPADVAYQQDEYVQLRLVNPEEGDLGDAPA